MLRMKLKYISITIFVAIFLIVLSQPLMAQYLYCEDTDGGLVYDVDGNVNYSYVSIPSPEEIMTVSDYCSEGTASVSECTGENCFINEYTCTGTEFDWDYNLTTERCTDLGFAGCSNGACTGTVPSCSDGIQNQEETDVDCGGPCGATCENGQNCSSYADCQSGYCQDGVCATFPGPGEHCTNGIQDYDEEGVDCGGAYCPPCEIPAPCYHCFNGIQDYDEEGIDCGGPYCPPCGTPDICEEPGCDERDFICDTGLETVSICISGVWMNAPDLYNQYCDGGGVCIPGAMVCNYQDRSVTTCQDNGQWGEPLQLESFFNEYCENRECNPGERQCDFEETGTWICNENGVWEEGPGGDFTANCIDMECNPGELFCNYVAELGVPVPFICSDEGLWVPVLEEDSEDFCEIPPDVELCNEGEKRCNFEEQVVEYCIGGVWGISLDLDPNEYNEICSDKECNQRWFLCKPIERKVSFCDETGNWGPEQIEGFSFYCEPREVTLAGDPGQGPPFSEGETRVIVGEIRDSEVIIHRGISPFPKKEVSLPKKDVCPEESPLWFILFLFSKIGDFPWWLIILIILLLILLGIATTSTVYFYKKYRDEIKVEDKSKVKEVSGVEKEPKKE